MRARLIKPGFFKNEVLALLTPHAQLLFAGLWCLADRAGRLEDRPLRIKAEILPYVDLSVDQLLNELAGEGFILRYAVAGSRYIQVVKFSKHQSPHKNEPASILPAPEEHHTSTVLEPEEHSTTRAVTLNPIPVAVTGSGSGVARARANGADAPAGANGASAPTPDQPPSPLAPKKSGARATCSEPGRQLLAWWCSTFSKAFTSDSAKRQAGLLADDLLRQAGGNVLDVQQYLVWRVSRGQSPDLRWAARDYGPGWHAQAQARASPSRNGERVTPADAAAYALELEAMGR